MVPIALVTTGTELTTGRTADTNAARAGQILGEAGGRIVFHVTVGDDRAAIADAVRLAAARARVVLVSGGLGPTRDDLTRWALAALARRRLEVHRSSLDRLVARMAPAHMGAAFASGIAGAVAANNVLQALVPRGAEVLRNRLGTAPGFAVRVRGAWCLALPGVPVEFEAMLRESVVPWLRRRGLTRPPAAVWRLTLCGVPESTADDAIGRTGVPLRGLEIALTVHFGVVRIAIAARRTNDADARRRAGRLHRALRRRFAGAVASAAGLPLEEAVARDILRRRRTLAIAESCTGGLIARKLAAVPGISASLLEAVVSYGNRSKVRRLGVPAALIRRRGAVSAEVAAAMARGAARTAGADAGLSATGIAGPSGGTRGKPVGLVFLGAWIRGRAAVERRRFRGDRVEVQERAALAALDLLRRTLNA